MIPEAVIRRVRHIAPHTALSIGALAIAAYLCLANLDYVTLWHDEVLTSFIGKNLLELGDIVGWDGRNLVGGANGKSLNDDLRDMGSPVQYLLSAASLALFGTGEFGARFPHALCGLAALGVFYLLLRRLLPAHPRLAFFILLFAAGSAQLLLYFRQARYYGVVVLCAMASFYLYERYWRDKHPLCLAGLTLAITLMFFSHYGSAAGVALGMAAWHLAFRARQTTMKEYIAFAACGAVAGSLALGYLVLVGLIGANRDPTAGFLSHGRLYPPWPELLWLKVSVLARDLFTADWVSWPVLLWFAGMCLLGVAGRRSAKVEPLRRRAARGFSASERPPASRQVCAASGASIDFRRTRSPATSRVSPSTTRGVPSRVLASVGPPERMAAARARARASSAICCIFAPFLRVCSISR